MNDIQIIENIPSNFLILEQKINDEYKSVDNDKDIYIIQETSNKIKFTNVMNSKKIFFYKDDNKTSDTLSIIIKNLKNSRIIQRYSTLTEPLSHLVLFEYNNINLYLYYTIPNLFLDTIELFDSTTKDVKIFTYKNHTVEEATSFRYNTLDFFIKNNDLKSIVIDDNEYKISTITNRFYQHLSSVIIGKITVGEPLYIKSFLFNDKTIIDVFQERKYDVIDATQKFLICKRNYKFKEPIYSFSTLLDQEENKLRTKNLKETSDLSSFVLNKQHIRNILKITNKWSIYTLYMRYVKYLNGENNFFSKYTYEEIKELFRANKSITFKKNVTRKRKINLKQKANLFYNWIISDNIQFNFSILELVTQGTKYSHLPDYIIKGYLEKINSKSKKSINDDVFKFVNDMTGILTHKINNINSEVMNYIDLLSGNINQNTLINSEQKKEALLSGRENVQIMKQSRADSLSDIMLVVGNNKTKDRNFILNSNKNPNIIISDKISVKNFANKMIQVNDNFLIAFTYLHFKQNIDIKTILNNFSKSINELFRLPRVGQTISNAKIPNSLQKIFLLRNGVKSVLSDVTLLNNNFTFNKNITENVQNIREKFNVFQNTGCKTLDCNNPNGNISSSSSSNNTSSSSNNTSSSSSNNIDPSEPDASQIPEAELVLENDPSYRVEMNYLGGPGIEIDEDGNEVKIRVDGDGNKITTRPGELPYAEDVTDGPPAIVIGETDNISLVDRERQLLTIFEEPETRMKMYLWQYGDYKSEFKFLKPFGNANNPRDYTRSISLDNRVIPGLFPQDFERAMYNRKFLQNFPPSYAEERHGVNTFKFTIERNGNTWAEELNKELSSDIYTYKSDGLDIKIDGINVVKFVPINMIRFIRKMGVESKFISISYFRTFIANRAVKVYRPGSSNQEIMIGGQGKILEGDEKGRVQHTLARIRDLHGDDFLNQLPVPPSKQREVDDIVTEMYKGYNDVNNSIYDKQWTNYHYWVGNPEFLDDVNKDLSDDSKFEKIIYCTEIDDQNLFSQEIDLDDSQGLSTGKIYYFETESGKKFIAERAGKLEVQDFDPNRLYNIIETIENCQDGSIDHPDLTKRSFGFRLYPSIKRKLYANMRERFYPENINAMNSQTFLQNTDNRLINDRIQKIEHIISTNNLSIFEKYVLSINNFYDFNKNELDISNLINIDEEELEKLSYDLQSARFNYTFAINKNLFSGLNYKNNDPIVDLKKEIYRFIIPNQGMNGNTAEIDFNGYSEKLLDQFIELDPELKEIFNRIGNIRKIRLNDRDIYIDLHKKTFVGDFSTEGAKNILNYVEFEESKGEYKVTSDYNIQGPDGSIFQFDTQYNRFGNDFYQTFPDIHIADNKIVYVSHNMNIESGFTFDIRSREVKTYSKLYEQDIDFIIKIEDIYETDNNIIKEIIFEESNQTPALHKISYIFNKTEMINEGLFRGKPQIEVIIENENLNGKFKQKGFFEGKKEISFNLSQVQNDYASLIQNSNFDKASSRYDNSNTINKIKNSYLSAENINHVRIENNFFDTYDMTKEVDNIIDLVNSNFPYNDKNKLTKEDVEEFFNPISSSSSSSSLSIDDIKIEEQGDSIIELKKNLFLNEYKLRKQNLSYLDEMYTRSFSLKEQVKFNNDIKDLFLIGNLDEEELRMQYIRSPTKVKNFYIDNYKIIHGLENIEGQYFVESAYEEYFENKNVYELEITRAIIAQSSNGDDTLKLSSFNEILGEQVFQNSEIIWNENQRYYNILNKSVCEFTPILIDENSGEVIYKKHYKKVDLDKELKDTNMNKRYVILDDNDGKYYEIYKSKDIENIKNIWKILPLEIMQNRDKLFLEQLSDKMFSSSGNIFDQQKNTGYSDTQSERLEKHRSAWNKMYNDSLIDSIPEFDIPTPNIADVNKYIESFANDAKRKNNFKIVENFLLKKIGLTPTSIVPDETLEEIKLAIFGIDDEYTEMTPYIKNKQLNMTNGFFNWFVAENNLKVGSGSNTIKKVKKKFSEKSLSEWKMSNEYNNLQINNKNRENILKRKVESYDNYNLIENIYNQIGYENVETFSDKQIELIDEFFNESTEIFSLKWNNLSRKLKDEQLNFSRKIIIPLQVWYDDKIDNETDEDKKNELTEEKKNRIKKLREIPKRHFQFKMITSVYEGVSKQYDLQSPNFSEKQINTSGDWIFDEVTREMFEKFNTLKDSLGDRFKKLNYKEFVDELENKLKPPKSADDKFRLINDNRFIKLKSYLETPYNLDEILEVAEFERIYEQYKDVLLKITEDNNLQNSIDDFNRYQPDLVPKLEEAIGNRFDESSLKEIVMNNISEEKKFYTVDRNNIQDGKYNMKENSLKDIIEKNYNKLRRGDYIIEENRIKYGDSIDNMKVKNNLEKVDISEFEELETKLKEKKIVIEGDENAKKIIAQRKFNAEIEFAIQKYNLYLPRNNSERRLLNRYYDKYKRDSSDSNARSFFDKMDELDRRPGKYDIGLTRTEELDIQYRFNRAKKTINIDTFTLTGTFIDDIDDELKEKIKRRDKRKRLINQFFAVLYTLEDVDENKIKQTARIVFDKILNPIDIDNFNININNIRNILENENNLNNIVNYRDEINELEIKKKKINEIDSVKNQYNSIKFSNIADSKEIENYQNILNQEMEELEISEIARNHNTNFYTTLGIKDNFFKKEIETMLYETTVTELPSGGEMKVFTREENTGNIKYIDWLNSTKTQETIANNNGYIDPPVIDKNYSNWNQYYNSQSQKWRKVLDQDFISLDLFDWNEVEGKITATFNPKKKPESIVSRARELLKQNNIAKLDRYMKSNKKYLDNNTIQQNLPVGQPIKINGVYFIKIFGNNVIRNNPNLQNDTNQFLVKITENQIKKAQENSITIKPIITSKKLKSQLEKKFNIKLNENIIDHIISQEDVLPDKLNMFNIYQINNILYEIKKNISKPDSSRERQNLRNILETRRDYIDKEVEKMETVLNMLSDEELNANFRSMIEEKLKEQGITPNKNLINKLFEHFQNEILLLEETVYFDDTKIRAMRDNFINKTYIPLVKEEYNILKDRTIANINEMDISVVDNTSIIRNFEDTSLKLETQRNIFNLSRSNLRKTMTTILEDYANRYYPNNPEVKEFFKKDIWFKPENSTKETILETWNDFKENNIAGINLEAPDPPLPQDYATNSINYFEQAYKQSSVYFDIASSYMNTRYGRAFQALTLLGLGGLGVFGIIQMTKEDQCNATIYDRETGERKKPDTDCNPLNIQEMTNFCERISNNAEGKKYVYDIKIGDQYQRRHTDEGEFLAQDPKRLCTANGESNTNLLKNKSICSQSCSEYNMGEIEETREIVQQTCIEKYNIPEGNHKLENIIRLTGKSLNELTNECSLETLLSKYVFGITENESQNI